MVLILELKKKTQYFRKYFTQSERVRTAVPVSKNPSVINVSSSQLSLHTPSSPQPPQDTQILQQKKKKA